MIYYILEVYLKLKKKKRSIKNHNYIVYIFIAILSILSILSLFLYKPVILLLEVLIFIFLCVVICVLDKENVDNSPENLITYIAFLNDFKKELANNKIYISSEATISYLIGECDNIIETRTAEKKKVNRYFKAILLPVITFLADLINSNTSDIKMISSIIAIISIIIIMIYLINVISALVDIVLKTGSVSEIKSLKKAFNDLKILDN